MTTPYKPHYHFKWTITAGDGRMTVRLRRLDTTRIEAELGQHFDGDNKVLTAQATIPLATQRTYVHLAEDTATGNLWALTFKPVCRQRV